MSAITPVCRRRTRLAAGLLATAVLVLLALPGIALATPPTAPPDGDAQCDTFPTTYPADGVPVPPDASCAIVLASGGIAVAEVWTWGDDTGLHWYNYLAEGYVAGAGSALTMCATDDESAAGVDYQCSTDSYYLLFTTANLFVTWPSEVQADLYFCEAADVVGPDGVAMTSYACGTLARASKGGDDSAPGQPPPTTPPPSTAPATTAPPAAPTTAPADPVDDDPADPDDPASPPIPPAGDPAPTTTAPTIPVPSGSDPRNPHALPEDAFDPGPVATPVDSQSVAVVRGAAFPVVLVFLLAAAFALGGVSVLAGPGVLASIRRRA